MPPRLRKLIGTILIIILVLVYALVATTVAADYSDWRARQNPHHTAREWLTDNSRLIYSLDLLLRKIGVGSAAAPRPTTFVDRGQVAIFENNLFNIASLARAHGVEPVLVTFNLAL